MAYNSQFTGAQIDEAIADVRSNKDAWDGKQDVILASGASVGDLIKAVGFPLASTALTLIRSPTEAGSRRRGRWPWRARTI